MSKITQNTTDLRAILEAVNNLPEATEPNLGEKVITENGSYSASDEGFDGYSKVEVNVPTSDGEIVLEPTDVKFGSEAIDPDQRYKVGYNWVAQVVDHLQDMVGRTSSFTLEEIVYWLGRVKYIPQGYAESTLTLSFDAGASGRLPVVHRGAAASTLALNFETSATGALQEG